eukprot:66502-Ditylum_brightwellii.AAC.1
MDSYDQQLFNKSLNERLGTTPQSKQHWLAAVHIAVNDFKEVNGRLPTQLTIKSFFAKGHTTSNNNTETPNSMFSNSMSQSNYPEFGTSEPTSYREEEDFWADPTGDFDPLF